MTGGKKSIKRERGKERDQEEEKRRERRGKQ
jgi:hypothetical protein